MQILWALRSCLLARSKDRDTGVARALVGTVATVELVVAESSASSATSATLAASCDNSSGDGHIESIVADVESVSRCGEIEVVGAEGG